MFSGGKWSSRRMRGAGAVALALTSSLTAVGSVHAGFSSCRSDPVVTLSNGAQIDLQATIATDLSNVQSVVYILDAPAGTRVINVVNTDGLMGIKEHFTFRADEPAHAFESRTIAFTRSSRVAVTAYTTVLSPLGLTLGSSAAQGMSNQVLTMRFTSLPGF